jgi:hypothetical protein
MSRNSRVSVSVCGAAGDVADELSNPDRFGEDAAFEIDFEHPRLRVGDIHEVCCDITIRLVAPVAGSIGIAPQADLDQSKG